ncbi:uncharacterized protein LOC127833674 isoform X1 [Dreissena polymorpha]|uniref:uncharacterized protein LOC127833674 isoform X1 n=1 Tax=Dreissena polymorpha TaxID=45954 RepID=UPI002264FFD4|nr:uncharacterized protein LOC127833674 isoform X1 [Dreissena polymorpha]
MRFYEADNRSVVMEIYDQFYLFDLEKMDVSIVFPGRVVDTRVCILTKRKQLLVTSRFGKNVKRYNITNGCIDAIIKTGHKKEIYQVVSEAHIAVLQVNDPGTLAAVTVEMGPVMVMDLVTHSRMYEISNILGRRYGGRYMLFDSYMLLNRVSSRLFFIGGYVGERTDNEVQLFSWDTEQIRLFVPFLQIDQFFYRRVSYLFIT